MDKAEIKQQTQELLDELNQAIDTDKSVIIGQIMELNDKLINKYTCMTHYKVYPTCDFADAKSVVKLHLFQALFDGQIVDWEQDFPKVFCRIVDMTKRSLNEEYSEGGVKMSYSTRRRRRLKDKLHTIAEYNDAVGGPVKIDLEHGAIQSEFVKKVRHIIEISLETGKLTEDDVSLLKRHALKGESLKQISVELNKTEAAIRAQYRKTIEKLRWISEFLYPDIEDYLYL